MLNVITHLLKRAPCMFVLILVSGCVTAVPIKHDYNSNKVIKDEHYYFELGRDFVESGKYQEAINAYKQAIKIKPDYAEAQNNLGLVYGKLGSYQEAINTFNHTIRIKPDYADAHLNLGYALGKVANYLEAKDAYILAIRIKPDYADAHLNLALTYLILGDKGSALDEYRILKGLDKESAKKVLTHILKRQSNDTKRTAKPEINLTSEKEPNNLLIKYEKVIQEREKLNNEIKPLKRSKNIENNDKNPGNVKLSIRESTPEQRIKRDNAVTTISSLNKVKEEHPLEAGPLGQNKDDNSQIYTIQTGRFLTIDFAREHIVYITYLLQEKDYDNLRIGKLGNFYIVRLGKFENNQTAKKFLQEVKPSLSEAIILKADLKNESIIRLYK